MLPVAGASGISLEPSDVPWIVAVGVLHGFLALTLVIAALGHLKTVEYIPQPLSPQAGKGERFAPPRWRGGATGWGQCAAHGVGRFLLRRAREVHNTL